MIRPDVDDRTLNRALLEACEEQHRAIDWLLAKIIELDPTFFPSNSPAWPAVVRAHAAIAAGRERSGA